MIIKSDEAGYDGSFRLVVYTRDDQGQTVAQRVKSDMDDQIATFYDQRKQELDRLRRELIGQRISPISLLMQYQNMTHSDLATRMKLSKRKVRRHLTVEGFKEVTVDQLQRYAKVFDVAVCDFFQFILLDPGLSYQARNECDRLVQMLEMKAEQK
jgi:hypothetical protein